ncbi:MAG: DUF4332 domain-containing protein [Gemmatimonadota bacterium]
MERWPRNRGARGARLVAAAAGLGLLAGTILAADEVRPFSTWYYAFAWYPVLLLLDAGVAARAGRYPLLGRPAFAVSLWLWSVPVWLLFELLNFRVANWYYVFAPGGLALRRLNAFLAFGTVLPAIFLGHRTLEGLGLFRGARGPRLRARRWRGVLPPAGGLFLGLAMWRPLLFFPLVWGGLTLLLEPWNYRRDPGRSLLGDLTRGRYGRLLRLLATGAGIGLLWELFNSFSETRWIYTVPGLETGKLFEMPVLGYLGFPVFALDCFVIYQALVNVGIARPGWGSGRSSEREGEGAAAEGIPAERSARPVEGTELRRVRNTAAWSVAALFALTVLAGMDRWTVDSVYPRLRDLPGVEGTAVLARLQGAGLGEVRELAASDPADLADRTDLPATEASRLVERAQLALLRGLGTTNAAALVDSGIGSVCALARSAPPVVAGAIRARRSDPRAGHVPRIRGWLRAARRECERSAARSESG